MYSTYRLAGESLVLKGNKIWLKLCLLTLTFNEYVFANDWQFEPGVRWRYQDINDEVRGDGAANTLKFRAQLSWQAEENWGAIVELDSVHALNEGNFNSVTIQQNSTPIPDPEGTRFNQFLLKYQSDGDWAFKLGRQSISFDQGRHIGGNEFWQHEHSFDALRYTYQDNFNWRFDYVYIDDMQRIFGPEAKNTLPSDDIRFPDSQQRPVHELGLHKHDSHLAHLEYDFDRATSLGAYYYLLDNKTQITESTATLGAFIKGAIKPEKVKYSYKLEWARQKDNASNPWHYQADYYFAEIAAQIKSHSLALSYEKLGAGNGFDFQTPLGSNHKFLGWADIFNGYRGGEGIQDWFVTYKGRDGKLRWRTVLHKFNEHGSSNEVGKELDIELAYRYSRKLEFKLAGAFYFSDDGLYSLPASQQDLTMWFVSVNYNI